ncbi:hypothetical protein EPIR_2919 [Erwinia piriflorinigrans CFBP 5888]|uniref:Uncharacterized protein n=1 Tax=Erwinia piriflorinigrans CFBP 5888 TaxID=1161919 RepID=V5ZB69_9GAMM|nr:hypothetical protein EPIR_2919 [Erwinia piriflorinigrans CFBP 5888]
MSYDDTRLSALNSARCLAYLLALIAVSDRAAPGSLTVASEGAAADNGLKSNRLARA